MKNLIFILAAILMLAASCDYHNDRFDNQLSKSVVSLNQSNVNTFSISQLYPNEEPPSSKETDKFIFTGTIAETDFNGGVFVVRTVDGNVGLKFDPKQMETAERERLKRVLAFGNQIECVGTTIDMALFTLLTAKIIEQ